MCKYVFLSGMHVCCSGKFDNKIPSRPNDRNEGEVPTPGQGWRYQISEVIHRQKIPQKEMQENSQYSTSAGGRGYFVC